MFASKELWEIYLKYKSYCYGNAFMTGDYNTEKIEELVELNNIKITKISPLHQKQTKLD